MALWGQMTYKKAAALPAGHLWLVTYQDLSHLHVKMTTWAVLPGEEGMRWERAVQTQLESTDYVKASN